MLTYNLSGVKGPLYEYIYRCIRDDIGEGRLAAGEKLPSKRTLASNLGVSTITIENSYLRLMDEGFIYALPKKGYYVADVSGLMHVGNSTEKTNRDIRYPNRGDYVTDLSSNRMDYAYFPFSIWAKLLRQSITLNEGELLTNSTCAGVRPLREAIAHHIAAFRGISVDPDQIIVGAGTEYLYGLIIQLLGRDKVYCLENLGYRKVLQVYASYGVKTVYADVDDKGMNVDGVSADVLHITPTHHFPTGISMPATRRTEVLGWALKREGRYIIEDDYDSEFRVDKKPMPALFSMDSAGRTIYMNTFSKSLAPTIRISYMVLPVELANMYYERLSFYTCTVSNFEQYTLANFISEGYFEKHINRMRHLYADKRKRVLEIIREEFDESMCRVIERDQGLHFLLKFAMQMSDREFIERLRRKKIHMTALSECYMNETARDTGEFILNYSGLDIGALRGALQSIRGILEEDNEN
ncbi:MAG: PLP-dependent aminotransferase family protein [Lachnospiraceae bacterium]|nr:PLP-dependent aminotransferase family protein [Lachnospiraceae bacterium]